jgi:homoserine dehydrogenase
MTATAQSAFDLAVAANGPRRPLRIALLGFGTVGQSVARILAERPELSDRLQLTHVYNRGVSRKRVDWVSGPVNWTEDLEDLFSSAPDVLVEVMGGVEPAFTVVKQAMERGASVVTANKMLLAAHGPELLKLASARGVQLRFEAAVAGGVPLIHGVREGLAGDQLTGVAGILNGTCNYILSRMAATDEDMTPVLADAQRL